MYLSRVKTAALALAQGLFHQDCKALQSHNEQLNRPIYLLTDWQAKCFDIRLGVVIVILISMFRSEPFIRSWKGVSLPA
jgi:hypothetical protein